MSEREVKKSFSCWKVLQLLAKLFFYMWPRSKHYSASSILLCT